MNKHFTSILAICVLAGCTSTIPNTPTVSLAEATKGEIPIKPKHATVRMCLDIANHDKKENEYWVCDAVFIDKNNNKTMVPNDSIRPPHISTTLDVSLSKDLILDARYTSGKISCAFNIRPYRNAGRSHDEKCSIEFFNERYQKHR
ncbi:hypothetical protein [Pseudoalteromonas nigrifaciens]|uniref:hypothetical protein n=1 Tax=Pseudoalteromonas nigrifaciens TaxID=28109 RepID=UPI003FD18045